MSEASSSSSSSSSAPAIRVKAPVFGVARAPGSKPSILSLDDIFSDFLFHGGSKDDGDDFSGDDFSGDDDGDEDKKGDGRQRKRVRGLHRNMSEDQKVERR